MQPRNLWGQRSPLAAALGAACEGGLRLRGSRKRCRSQLYLWMSNAALVAALLPLLKGEPLVVCPYFSYCAIFVVVLAFFLGFCCGAFGLPLAAAWGPPPPGDPAAWALKRTAKIRLSGDRLHNE